MSVINIDSVLLHSHVHDIGYLFFLMVLIFIMADAYYTLYSKNCEKYNRSAFRIARYLGSYFARQAGT